MRWGAEQYLHLLWLAPGLLMLFIWFSRQGRARLDRFGASVPRLVTGERRGKGAFRLFLFLAAIALIAVTLARPQIGTKEVRMKRSGFDVMIALDTSYSMAAEDAAPNRLARAKKEVERITESLAGNRVGLLLFAGDSVVECPLTTDVSTMKMILSAVGYNAVSRGGTDISGAIRKSAAALRSSGTGAKVIVLLTDGEDLEGNPLEEAKKAAKDGVMIYAVGVGSKAGAPIPLRDEKGKLTGYKKDGNGQVVMTKQDDSALHAIAETTGGMFVSLQDGDISPVIESILKQEKGEFGEQKSTVYEERFQIPLVVALVLLVVEFFI
ncbi:MAG: VWA domain-containing protein [Nitrospinae bacterium]|nr:VWA domain-containing protein [Nitrospinota bacterium]